MLTDVYFFSYFGWIQSLIWSWGFTLSLVRYCIGKCNKLIMNCTANEYAFDNTLDSRIIFKVISYWNFNWLIKLYEWLIIIETFPYFVDMHQQLTIQLVGIGYKFISLMWRKSKLKRGCFLSWFDPTNVFDKKSEAFYDQNIVDLSIMQTSVWRFQILNKS